MGYLKVRKLDERASLEKASPGAAAYDLVATSICPTVDGQFIVGTGLTVAIPEGYVGLLFPRSSVFRKGAYLANSVGVIDSDYRGEIKAIFRSLRGAPPYELGERCCQLLLVELGSLDVKYVEQLDNTTRGEGGFGSTGQA
jgi:dUTP pyrophosphatase